MTLACVEGEETAEVPVPTDRSRGKPSRRGGVHPEYFDFWDIYSHSECKIVLVSRPNGRDDNRATPIQMTAKPFFLRTKIFLEFGNNNTHFYSLFFFSPQRCHQSFDNLLLQEHQSPLGPKVTNDNTKTQLARFLKYTKAFSLLARNVRRPCSAL